MLKQTGVMAAMFAVTLLCMAQSSPKPRAAQVKHRHRRATAVRPPALPSGPQPAVVKFDQNRLTIIANNADLGQILKQVTGETGMTVGGQAAAGVVFGTYGPGVATDVLRELLASSGYGYLLLGQTAAGAPRELILMRPGAGAASSQNSAARAASASESAPIGGEHPDETAAEASGQASDPARPGAIQNVPPNEADGARGDQNSGARRRQQMQNLQQMQAQGSPQ